MPIIKIIRVWSPADSIIRNYKVMLDDVFIRNIKIGETIDLDVTPGQHSIYLHINWCKSSRIDFVINENETKEFACGSFLRIGEFLFFAFSLGIEALVYRTYLRDYCLLINPVDINKKDNNEEIEKAFRELQHEPRLKRKYFNVLFLGTGIYLAFLGSMHLLFSYERILGIILLAFSLLEVIFWYWNDVDMKRKEKR